MKRLLFLLLIPTLHFSTSAQSVKTRPLKKVMTLKMPRTVDDEMPGTRGACVAWHPLQKKYYAAMAGNMGYPLGVFDPTGKQLSSNDQNCNEDTRGLWYNPVKKTLEGNAYNDAGWFLHKLNAKGTVVETVIKIEGMNQPDGQCVGVLNPLKKEILFLFNGEVSSYSLADGSPVTTIEIKWGQTKADASPELAGAEEIGLAETPEDYNYTSLVYTGIKGSELGFLNITNSEIELYNIATGYLSARLALPATASVNPSFNFSFANGMYWLYNIEDRVWTGYK